MGARHVADRAGAVVRGHRQLRGSGHVADGARLRHTTAPARVETHDARRARGDQLGVGGFADHDLGLRPFLAQDAGEVVDDAEGHGREHEVDAARRGEAEVGQVAEYNSHPPSKERCDVLHDDVAGS